MSCVAQSSRELLLEMQKTDHVTSNTDACDAYTQDPNSIIIRSPSHGMSNSYKCYLNVFDMEFPSSVHAYQWRFIKYQGYDDLSNQLLDARTPAEAKEIASRVPRCDHVL